MARTKKALALKKRQAAALRKRAQELENEVLEEAKGDVTVEVVTDEADVVIEARRRAARKRRAAQMRRAMMSRRALLKRAQEAADEYFGEEDDEEVEAKCKKGQDEPEAEDEKPEDEVEARRLAARKRRAMKARRAAMLRKRAQEDEEEEPEAEEEPESEEEEPKEETARRAAKARALRKARKALRKKAQDVSDDLVGPAVKEIDIPGAGEEISDDLAEGDADDMVQQTESELPDSINEAEDKVEAAYQLVEAQIARKIISPNVKRAALASKYARKFTVGEMKLAAENLEKVGSSKTASKNIRVSPRKAMPVTKQASTNDDSCLFY